MDNECFSIEQKQLISKCILEAFNQHCYGQHLVFMMYGNDFEAKTEDEVDMVREKLITNHLHAISDRIALELQL